MSAKWRVQKGVAGKIGAVLHDIPDKKGVSGETAQHFEISSHSNERSSFELHQRERKNAVLHDTPENKRVIVKIDNLSKSYLIQITRVSLTCERCCKKRGGGK